MKRIIAAVTAVVCLLALLAGCKKEEPSPYLKGKHHVEIEVQDYGTIALELDADAAPISVTNFIELAKSGFYDGLTFHRIIEGFMIQGGDPKGNGTGTEHRGCRHSPPFRHSRGTVQQPHLPSEYRRYGLCDQTHRQEQMERIYR